MQTLYIFNENDAIGLSYDVQRDSHYEIKINRDCTVNFLKNNARVSRNILPSTLLKVFDELNQDFFDYLQTPNTFDKKLNNFPQKLKMDSIRKKLDILKR